MPAASLWWLPGIQTVPAEVAVVPPTMPDFSQSTTRNPSRVPTRAAVIPAAPAPTISRSVSPSQLRSSDKGMGPVRYIIAPAMFHTGCLQEPDRNPGYKRHQQKPDDERHDVARDRPQTFVRMDFADRAGCIVADAERRREQPHPHRKDDDH